MMNRRYQGMRDGPSSFASYGTQAHIADKLVLIDGKGEKPCYRARGETLEMFDCGGNPIGLQFNYTLQPVSTSLPMTPMLMRDMYLHVADAAIFTDRTTGKWMPVANNAQLERDHLAARAENGQSVLLTLETHFMLESNPDTGEKVKTLMTDKDAEFIPGKACN